MKMKTFQSIVKEVKGYINNEPVEVDLDVDDFDYFLRKRSNNKIHNKKKA